MTIVPNNIGFKGFEIGKIPLDLCVLNHLDQLLITVKLLFKVTLKSQKVLLHYIIHSYWNTKEFDILLSNRQPVV